MAELVGAVTKITSGFLEINSISIDNWGFKFFYKWTTTLLVFCSVLVTANQFFGSPIYCDASAARGGVEQDVLEAYCWMYSTWNIPKEYKGACSGGDQDDSYDTIVYNSYYQWVPLYLIFLAVIFYMPRCFWLMMEGGLMKFFGKGTTTRFIEDQDEKREKLVQFFCRNIHNKYNIYFCGFVFCELLNFIIVMVQFIITHRFLHYRFLTYGFQVWQYYLLPPEEQRMPGVKNPMCIAFPRIASCDYWRWGSGGRQESINAICILALNIINDKVFLVLWWWFLMLAIIGFIRILYRAVQCKSSRLRYHLINMRMNRYFKKSSKIAKIETFISKCKLGDWFVLYQLSKNLNRPFFMDFLTQLSIRYTEKSAVVDEEDPDDQGDNLVSMLLKPSYTTQESEKFDDDPDGGGGGVMVGNHIEPRKARERMNGKKRSSIYTIDQGFNGHGQVLGKGDNVQHSMDSEKKPEDDGLDAQERWGGEGQNYSVGWTDSDMDSESGHRDKMRQQAEHVFHQRQLSNGGGKVVEEIEMKRQLWLQSCRAGDSENPRKTYGSAFVAPLANPSPPAARSNGKLLPRRSSSKLFGVPSEDTQNLLDDMI